MEGCFLKSDTVFASHYLLDISVTDRMRRVPDPVPCTTCLSRYMYSKPWHDSLGLLIFFSFFRDKVSD